MCKRSEGRNGKELGTKKIRSMSARRADTERVMKVLLGHNAPALSPHLLPLEPARTVPEKTSVGSPVALSARAEGMAVISLPSSSPLSSSMRRQSKLRLGGRAITARNVSSLALAFLPAEEVRSIGNGGKKTPPGNRFCAFSGDTLKHSSVKHNVCCAKTRLMVRIETGVQVETWTKKR